MYIKYMLGVFLLQWDYLGEKAAWVQIHDTQQFILFYMMIGLTHDDRSYASWETGIMLHLMYMMQNPYSNSSSIQLPISHLLHLDCHPLFSFSLPLLPCESGYGIEEISRLAEAGNFSVREKGKCISMHCTFGCDQINDVAIHCGTAIILIIQISNSNRIVYSMHNLYSIL